MLGITDLTQTRVYQEGKQEGLQEGLQEGQLRAKLEMIPRLFSAGMNVEQIAQITALDIAQVQEITASLLTNNFIAKSIRFYDFEKYFCGIVFIVKIPRHLREGKEVCQIERKRTRSQFSGSFVPLSHNPTRLKIYLWSDCQL